MTTQELAHLKRLGFRRWYERQLIDSHVALVLALLAVVLVACGFELVAIGNEALGFILQAVLIFASGIFGWRSLRRYQTVMLRAEWISSNAVCPGCGRFGFKLQSLPTNTGAREPALMQVSCSKCQHRWPIDVSENTQ